MLIHAFFKWWKYLCCVCSVFAESVDAKLQSMLRTPNCPFVLFVGTKKLVKRKEFEQFISEKLVI